MSSAADSPSQQAFLGAQLRALRGARRLSLGEVAKETGISASFLSLVENGRSDITIGRLTRLVDYYGISIIDLLPSAEHADPDVVRAGETRLLRSPEEGTTMYLLASGTNRTMLPMLLELEPGSSMAERGHHAGEEFVHVLDGTLLLEVDTTEPQTLNAGDSAYYRADRPHLFRNASAEAPLRLICVDSPPPL
ncbi:MAG TPA: XRE family transcriptional regulator [Baekduia sp.]|uniref:helix-turn-helix domain-containing protein n=1 Tax=Baekduia sp. TaxID=2600305 RepID=UPI002D7706E0|nr:XRE family transcriptional regulator [Baekduia sp.]HET6508088.1 XRE family transcriptional regulator [Baekduia sp.]